MWRKLVERGILTDFYIVEDFAQEALKFFDLTRNSLGKGYNYPISELVGIYLCETDFILHFSGDSMPVGKSDWLVAALREF